MLICKREQKALQCCNLSYNSIQNLLPINPKNHIFREQHPHSFWVLAIVSARPRSALVRSAVDQGQHRLDLRAPKRQLASINPPETHLAGVDVSLCAGLFRPVDRKLSRHVGTRRKISYQRRWFLLDSAWRLGPDDLAMFLVMVAAATRTLRRQEASPSAQEPRQPSRFFGCVLSRATREEDWQRILPIFSRIVPGQGEESSRQATRAMLIERGNWIYLAPRMSLLISECGLSRSQSAYEAITESLQRLAAVTMTEISGPDVNARSVRRLPGDDLIAYTFDETDKRVHILLNRELVTPILGRMYVPVPVSETRMLGDVARLAHLHLCSKLKEFVETSNTDNFDLGDLARAVYAERDESSRIQADQSAGEVRDWCKKLRHKALGDTQALLKGERPPGPMRIADLPGWSVNWDAYRPRAVRITRPGTREIKSRVTPR